jgi:hypothetical protein
MGGWTFRIGRLDEVQTPKPKRERIVWIGQSPNHINLSVSETSKTERIPEGKPFSLSNPNRNPKLDFQRIGLMNFYKSKF